MSQLYLRGRRADGGATLWAKLPDDGVVPDSVLWLRECVPDDVVWDHTTNTVSSESEPEEPDVDE